MPPPLAHAEGVCKLALPGTPAQARCTLCTLYSSSCSLCTLHSDSVACALSCVLCAVPSAVILAIDSNRMLHLGVCTTATLWARLSDTSLMAFDVDPSQETQNSCTVPVYTVYIVHTMMLARMCTVYISSHSMALAVC